MRLRRLKVSDFRNLKNFEITFSASADERDGQRPPQELKTQAVIGQNGPPWGQSPTVPLGRGGAGKPWRYLGVGRWDEKEGAWAIPEVDFTTWRALGHGRSASRRLDERWNEKATELVERVLADPGPGGWVGSGDRRCRIVGPAQGGGVRIDGGEGGFAERTVSLTDIAWVLAASERSAETGAVLDEGLVNRLRCLDGTPKGSTRWIDTVCAVILRPAWRPLESTAPLQPLDQGVPNRVCALDDL